MPNWPPDSDATPPGEEPTPRLRRLKERIDRGTYEVPAEEIAQAILQFYARDTSAPAPDAPPDDI